MIVDTYTNLREIRKSKGLTVQFVAKQLNVNPNTVTRYETGVRTPDIVVLQKLADVYGVTLNELLGIPENEKTTLDEQLDVKEQMIDIIMSSQDEEFLKSLRDYADFLKARQNL